MSNSAVTPVSFSTKYYQMKTLSANFNGTNPATEVTDLRFSNVTIGKTYRVTIVAYSSGSNCNLFVQTGPGSDNTQYNYYRLINTNMSYSFSKIFIAGATTVKFYYSTTGASLISADGNETPTALTGGSSKTTYAILEEMTDTTSTTAYT